MTQENTLIRLPADWLSLLGSEFEQPYMNELRQFLRNEKSARKTIFPRGDRIFAAFDHTHFADVKVVILGQDPYHGAGQAHGLCFSVPAGVDIPPSLLNIYKELKDDIGMAMPNHGCLEKWADQGVLLLNSVLTVEMARAGSHRAKGWEQFTDRVIALLNEKKQHLVFLLWGSYAQEKGRIIDRSRHLVLEAPHPSPLSAYRGFIGCKHFSQTNDYLRQYGETAIDWSV